LKRFAAIAWARVRKHKPHSPVVIPWARVGRHKPDSLVVIGWARVGKPNPYGGGIDDRF